MIGNPCMWTPWVNLKKYIVNFMICVCCKYIREDSEVSQMHIEALSTFLTIYDNPCSLYNFSEIKVSNWKWQLYMPILQVCYPGQFSLTSSNSDGSHAGIRPYFLECQVLRLKTTAQHPDWLGRSYTLTVCRWHDIIHRKP